MTVPLTPNSGLRRRLCLSAAATVAAPWLGARAAQPSQAAIAGGRTITLVVSYPAGGGADLMARIVAPRLAYDSAKAFTPLAVLATFPNVLVCTPGFEAQSVRDVLRLARAKPGELAYASSGNGSAQHLAGALFEARAGVQLAHVPYRGGGPALNDVMGGQVPLFFANVASSLGHIQAGKLRALAVTSRVRTRSLPDVPTMEQAGVAGYEVLEWNPVLAPAGLPEATRLALVGGIRRALADPEVLGRVRQLGGDVFADASQASAGRFIREQQALWAQVVRERRISVG